MSHNSNQFPEPFYTIIQNYEFLEELGQGSYGTVYKTFNNNEFYAIKVISKEYVQEQKGFRAIHGLGIIHRDLKPDNIFIKDDVFKIGDFGFAKMAGEGQTQCGCKLYMAPELFLTCDHDYKADIWSLGVIFFYMIFQTYPFENKSAFLDEIIEKTTPTFQPEKILNQTIINEKMTPELKEFFQMVFQLEPDMRINFEDLYELSIIRKNLNESEQEEAKSFYYNLSLENSSRFQFSQFSQFSKLQSNLTVQNQVQQKVQSPFRKQFSGELENETNTFKSMNFEGTVFTKSEINKNQLRNQNLNSPFSATQMSISNQQKSKSKKNTTKTTISKRNSSTNAAHEITAIEESLLKRNYNSIFSRGSSHQNKISDKIKKNNNNNNIQSEYSDFTDFYQETFKIESINSHRVNSNTSKENAKNQMNKNENIKENSPVQKSNYPKSSSYQVGPYSLRNIVGKKTVLQLTEKREKQILQEKEENKITDMSQSKKKKDETKNKNNSNNDILLNSKKKIHQNNKKEHIPIFSYSSQTIDDEKNSSNILENLEKQKSNDIFIKQNNPKNNSTSYSNLSGQQKKYSEQNQSNKQSQTNNQINNKNQQNNNNNDNDKNQNQLYNKNKNNNNIKNKYSYKNKNSTSQTSIENLQNSSNKPNDYEIDEEIPQENKIGQAEALVLSQMITLKKQKNNQQQQYEQINLKWQNSRFPPKKNGAEKSPKNSSYICSLNKGQNTSQSIIQLASQNASFLNSKQMSQNYIRNVNSNTVLNLDGTIFQSDAIYGPTYRNNTSAYFSIGSGIDQELEPIIYRFSQQIMIYKIYIKCALAASYIYDFVYYEDEDDSDEEEQENQNLNKLCEDYIENVFQLNKQQQFIYLMIFKAIMVSSQSQQKEINTLTNEIEKEFSYKKYHELLKMALLLLITIYSLDINFDEIQFIDDDLQEYSFFEFQIWFQKASPEAFNAQIKFIVDSYMSLYQQILYYPESQDLNRSKTVQQLKLAERLQQQHLDENFLSSLDILSQDSASEIKEQKESQENQQIQEKA
ncbi:Protein kinase-like domain [Pseudocohnilembus persalinus]|uniref:non-specific serine/threonine protein kinase n=1 Tax=Pseudocohnilembus persalinus TaxID=266149 RepID=A0A0V0QL71_PSEPJ|nr:Protein kinase-like domain [Pseudocohnilembus persalinus]|eukprot:KRX02990.1 Protein kinase-like domain [Pseudocohnilembus persalinus]